jgi:hypothetical protein
MPKVRLPRILPYVRPYKPNENAEEEKKIKNPIEKPKVVSKKVNNLPSFL